MNEVIAETIFVVIGKVTLVAFAGMVTVAGTVAAFVLPLANVTTMPPVGAALVKETVPVEIASDTTLEELREIVFSVGAFTVKVAIFMTPFSVAVTVNTELVATETVPRVKVAVF